LCLSGGSETGEHHKAVAVCVAQRLVDLLHGDGPVTRANAHREGVAVLGRTLGVNPVRSRQTRECFDLYGFAALDWNATLLQRIEKIVDVIGGGCHFAGVWGNVVLPRVDGITAERFDGKRPGDADL